MNLTSEILVSIAGVVLSLLFSYIPGLRVWFGALVSEKKQLIMLAALIIVTGGVFGLGCAGVLDIGIPCDKGGVISIIRLLILALIANQSTYLISPQTNDVVIAKQLRDDGELEGEG